MTSHSQYEREFLYYLSQSGLVGRFAGSGILNTIPGDLIYLSKTGEVWIVEVKSTRQDVYYPSKNIRQISLLRDLSRVFPYRPVLAVRFVGRGWVIHDLSEGIPDVVTSDRARFLRYKPRSLEDWL